MGYMLEIRNISKTFNKGTINEKKALDRVNLNLYPGDFVTIIGGNGAGKSTTLNAIAGAWYVDEGQIIVDGTDITRLPEHKRAAYLGRVFQDPMTGTASTMSIEENMAIAARRGARRGLRWGISKKEREDYRHQLKELDLGLEDRLSSKVGLLSGWQRQAVTLLMAAARKPKLLLLDEPAAGMNPNETAELMDTIRFVRDTFHMTILLIEHDMKLVAGICEKLTVLNFGQVLTEGDTQTVLHDPQVISAYLGE